MTTMLKRLHQTLVISADDNTGFESSRLINYDTVPMPPERRKWGHVHYLYFWSIFQMSISNWQAAAALLGLGFNLPQAIGVSVLSKVAATLLSIGQGWIGGEWHIGYTIAQRMTFGINGAYIGIVIRVVLSVVWYAANTWLGGRCITLILSSWSYAFMDMRNTMPPSAHVATRDFISYWLFNLLSVPFLFLPPETSRYWLAPPTAVSFITMTSIFIWAMAKGGTGPLLHEKSHFSPELGPSWTWLYGFASGIGSVVTGLCNMSDFTRFSKKQGVQIGGTIFGIQVLGTILPVFALLTGSATINIWGGQPYWNPLDIAQRWMTDEYTAKTRAAGFFAGLGLLFSQFAANIYGNAYAGGIDLSGLFPLYINVRRGCVITALLSLAVQPWLFYNTSSVFLSVCSSFGVFLIPLIAIMMSDYFILRRQKIQLGQLYTTDPSGAFWFYHGFNWRAIIVWIVGWAPALPGFIANVNDKIHISKGAFDYFRGSSLFGFFGTALLYVVVVKIFPPTQLGLQDDVDIYGTFTAEEALRKGMVPFEGIQSKPNEVLDGVDAGEALGKEMSMKALSMKE